MTKTKHTEIRKWDYFTVEDGEWVVINTKGNDFAIVKTEGSAKRIVELGNSHQKLVDFVEWLDRFEMKFYVKAENPTYEKMKALYIELGDKLNEIKSQLEKDTSAGTGGER